MADRAPSWEGSQRAAFGPMSERSTTESEKSIFFKCSVFRIGIRVELASPGAEILGAIGC